MIRIAKHVSVFEVDHFARQKVKIEIKLGLVA